MNALADLFAADPAAARQAELDAAREANPDCLVFRANTWARNTKPTDPPTSTAVMVIKRGKRADRAPMYSSVLGMAAVFGIDEVDFNRPALMPVGQQ